MVTRINVGYRQDLDPCLEDATDAERKVPGPLHDKADVRRVSAGGAGKIVAWTRECTNDITYKLEWEIEDVGKLLEDALNFGKYLGSECCVQKPGGPFAWCDAYTVSRVEWIQSARKEMKMDYYIKFAISKPGTSILVASCHISRY